MAERHYTAYGIEYSHFTHHQASVEPIWVLYVYLSESKGMMERETLVCFQRNLSSFLTDGGNYGTVQIICTGY